MADHEESAEDSPDEDMVDDPHYDKYGGEMEEQGEDPSSMDDKQVHDNYGPPGDHEHPKDNIPDDLRDTEMEQS